jgi:peptidoglycan/LPS O-acetylase OafA/YrhL
MTKRLLLLNGLATILAVVHHGTHWSLTAMFWWTDRYRAVSVPNYDQLGGASYYAIRVIDQIAILGIPTFLVISGFFIAFSAGHTKKTIEWSLVFSRIRYLLIPYLLWSVAVLLSKMLQGESFTILEVIKILLTGTATAAYYYTPLLIVYYLFSPFIVPLARQRPLLTLFLSVLLTLPVMIARYANYLHADLGALEPVFALLRDSHVLENAYLFVLGVTAGLHLTEFKKFLSRIKWYLLPALIVTFVAGIIEWNYLLQAFGREWLSTQTTFFDKLFTVVLLLALFAFENLNPPKPALFASLGLKSYGVFLIHLPVQEFTARGIYHFAPGLLAHPLLILLIVTAVGLAVPLAMMEIVDRSLVRRYYRYIFG